MEKGGNGKEGTKHREVDISSKNKSDVKEKLEENPICWVTERDRERRVSHTSCPC